MGKKNKNKIVDENQDFEFEGHDVDYPVPFPERLDQELLATMDDESLYNLGQSLADSINKVNRYKLNPYIWEVEMCYLQQEMQLRNSRRAAHAAWLGGNHSTEMN